MPYLSLSLLMKTILVIAVFFYPVMLHAQSFCFYNPNIGPHYHNGSSGAIYDVTTGDFNSDGHADIVTANSVASDISFIAGYGNGTLGTPDTTTVPATLFCITSGDFNNDTESDVATANSGNIFVLLGNGDGTFQPYNSYPAGAAPSRIYSKDINNDIILDIIESCGNGIFILIGQSNGTFLPAVQYLTGLNSIDVTIADFDNDTILDIVSTAHITTVNSELYFLKGNGNGTFASPISIFSMTYPDNFIAGITSNDVDNDGNMDLIVANSSNSIHRIELYFGNGNGTINNPVFYPTFSGPFYVYLTDFDNDLIKDIVVEEGNGFTVLKGNSNGTFNTYQSFSAMTSPNALAIEDFNEDGKMDVIIPSAYFGSPLIAVNLNCTMTGIDDVLRPTNALMNIFPNPVNTFTTIQFIYPTHNAEINIYNVYGQEIKTIKNISGQEMKLFRDNLPSGLYFIRLTQDTKVISADKLVITD